MTKLEQPDNLTIRAAEFQAPTGIQQTSSFELTRWHWILFAVALFCLLFIAFITFARSIQINAVTPSLTNSKLMLSQSADIELESKIKLPIGNRVLVLPGTHQVVARAPGFQAAAQEISVGAGRHQLFELLLLPLPGQLAITLNPAVSAKLQLDGKFIATLPGEIENIPAGQHEISIDAPLYRAATKSIVVQGKGLTESLQIDLVPAWGNLSIDSLPQTASVLIDGEAVGRTPLQIKVEEGSHSLTIEADKFKPFSQEFTMITGQDLQVPTITLTPADGVLEVQSDPPRAAVILNGEYQGTSPISLRLKPDQDQRLQIYKAGYRLQGQQISLAPDQRETRKFSLQQDVSQVRFSIVPPDAELIVDGVSRGRGSQTLKLNTLPHAVIVRKTGYVSYQNRIIPTKSGTQVVSVRLLTKAQDFWAKVPDRYTTAAGQSMKLFKNPGEVKLGSSRRETGRRSNEVEYTARLKKHFYVSLQEVSNKQFRLFSPNHNSGNYKRKSLDSGRHPVANVSWQQAALYCNWLSAREKLQPFYQTKSGFVSGNNAGANGYRLLTEVEWSWLARNNGGQLLTYPWGNSPQIKNTKAVGNFADINAVEFIAFTLADYDDGYKASSPVGRFPANHSGLFDMEGNVSEWVNDWYSSNSQYAAGDQPVLVDPLGPAEGEFHVIRGASWARGHLPQLRLAYRDFGAKGKHDVGFRIARYVGEPD